VVQLLGHDQLLVPDLVSGIVVSSDNTLNGGLSFPDTVHVISDDQHVLLVLFFTR